MAEGKNVALTGAKKAFNALAIAMSDDLPLQWEQTTRYVLLGGALPGGKDLPGIAKKCETKHLGSQRKRALVISFSLKSKNVLYITQNFN